MKVRIDSDWFDNKTFFVRDKLTNESGFEIELEPEILQKCEKISKDYWAMQAYLETCYDRAEKEAELTPEAKLKLAIATVQGRVEWEKQFPHLKFETYNEIYSNYRNFNEA